MCRRLSPVQGADAIQESGVILREGAAFLQANQTEIRKEGRQRPLLEGSYVPVRIVSAAAFGTPDQRLLQVLAIRDAHDDVFPADALQLGDGPGECPLGQMLEDLETGDQVEGKGLERQSVDVADDGGTSNPTQRQAADVDACFLIGIGKRVQKIPVGAPYVEDILHLAGDGHALPGFARIQTATALLQSVNVFEKRPVGIPLCGTGHSPDVLPFR
jgi:hypothetical protein